MEEAIHFFDELKDKYLHQVEQAIDDWDFQDFSPDKRCALLDNEETVNLRDDPASLVAVCTPPGGIQGIPDADSVQRLLAHVPRLDASKVATAFAARLQDDAAQRCWQVRAKALVLMQMLVEIRPFSSRYLPAFQAHGRLQQQLDALRLDSHKHVVCEGARKLLSLIRSNGSNPQLLPKGSATTKPHIRHAQLRSVEKAKKSNSKTATTRQPHARTVSPGKAAMSKVFKPTPISPQSPSHSQRPSLVASPKVSQAARASWVRRTSEKHLGEDTRMPFQKIQPAKTTKTDSQGNWKLWNYSEARGGVTTRPASSSISTSDATYSSRFNSGNLSAFSFVH
ncbi:hypothetical protein BBJ28_00006167 [Nothophytophthora sp. Chile5]|nr:hypothetical protein BBJ28_00006167 [Nothophytophthora sp. Chile5]